MFSDTVYLYQFIVFQKILFTLSDKKINILALYRCLTKVNCFTCICNIKFKVKWTNEGAIMIEVPFGDDNLKGFTVFCQKSKTIL